MKYAWQKGRKKKQGTDRKVEITSERKGTTKRSRLVDTKRWKKSLMEMKKLHDRREGERKENARQEGLRSSSDGPRYS